jgi:hypothetical protein
LGDRSTKKLAGVVVWLATASAAMGCTQQEPALGQLIVVIDSDVSVRQSAASVGDIDRVQVEVTQNDLVLLNRDWFYPFTELTLPQTISVVNEGDDASAAVHLVLTASRDGSVTFVQSRKFVVPFRATTYAVMRFEWLCRGFAKNGSIRPESGCPANETCRGGICQSEIALPADEMSTPAPSDCFDTLRCFENAEDITARIDSGCNLTLSPETVGEMDMVNVAIEPVLGQGGICGVDTSKPCLVGMTGEPLSGWSVSDNRLSLPVGTCALIARGDMIARVWLSRSCATRQPNQSICSPWRSPNPVDR